LLVLVGIERGDGPAEAGRMADRLVGYRVFADPDGRMNRSVADVAGGLLVVPQFTLAANTGKGMRPSFTPAASPEDGRELFEILVGELERRHAGTRGGSFGAHMQVALLNDGPVTFLLRVLPSGGG
jgi:D-tyrosyl-tRNA(Tyr) deacylase